MRGVPADLDLRPFVGTRLDMISLGKFQLQFHFTRPEAPFATGANLSIEGYWELRAAGGELLDHGPNASREGTETVAQETFRAHALLARNVATFLLNPPKSFTLIFDDGQQLCVFDNSDRYESFSIQPGDIFI
jgi:hypothetical protein